MSSIFLKMENRELLVFVENIWFRSRTRWVHVTRRQTLRYLLSMFDAKVQRWTTPFDDNSRTEQNKNQYNRLKCKIWTNYLSQARWIKCYCENWLIIATVKINPPNNNNKCVRTCIAIEWVAACWSGFDVAFRAGWMSKRTSSVYPLIWNTDFSRGLS